MKNIVYYLIIIVALLGCAGPDAEPAPGLQTEDIIFGNNAPIIDDITYSTTNNQVVPTTVTLTGQTRYAGILEWSYLQVETGSLVRETTLKGPDESISFNFTTPGTYTVQLRAYHNRRAYDSKDLTQAVLKTVKLIVQYPAPQISSISFTGTATKVPAGLTFFCTPSASSTSSPINSFSWSFGDGASTTVYGINGYTSHSYSKTGTYTVTVTANGPGGSGTFSRNIKIG